MRAAVDRPASALSSPRSTTDAPYLLDTLLSESPCHPGNQSRCAHQGESYGRGGSATAGWHAAIVSAGGAGPVHQRGRALRLRFSAGLRVQKFAVGNCCSMCGPGSRSNQGGCRRRRAGLRPGSPAAAIPHHWTTTVDKNHVLVLPSHPASL